MGKHNETGARGEQIAQEFLQAKGYTLLHRNWRTARKEVDLIALDGEMLVFIEIKTRSGFAFGFPEEAVGPQKQQHLRVAATAFLRLFPQYRTVRFDVVSIMLRNGHIEELRHLVDAF
jgi:putative endonuclease